MKSRTSYLFLLAGVCVALISLFVFFGCLYVYPPKKIMFTILMCVYSSFSLGHILIIVGSEKRSTRILSFLNVAAMGVYVDMLIFAPMVRIETPLFAFTMLLAFAITLVYPVCGLLGLVFGCYEVYRRRKQLEMQPKGE